MQTGGSRQAWRGSGWTSESEQMNIKYQEQGKHENAGARPLKLLLGMQVHFPLSAAAAPGGGSTGGQ